MMDGSRLARPERVLLLCADNSSGLVAQLAVPDEHLLTLSEPEPKPWSVRLGIVGPTPKKLALARKVVAGGKPWYGRQDLWFCPNPPLVDGRGGTAFVFPGLEAEFAPSVDDVARWLGVPPPALGTGSIGPHAASVITVGRLLNTALCRLAIRPDAVVGHSVGEWAAMIAGGLFDGRDFDDLLDRTDLDSLVVPGVQFAVLGCPVDQVRDGIAGRPELVVSHENSTRQTVVCGPDAAIAELIAGFRARGVICQTLPFRSGFHTPMLRPYLEPFRTGVAALPVHPATVPVWSATAARPFPVETEAVRRLCVRHLLEPVRFRATVHAMHASGIRVFVQMGAGQLGSLVDDTLRNTDHITVAANAANRPGLDQLRRVATALWVAGARPDFAALDPKPVTGTTVVVQPDPLARLAALGAGNPLVGEFHALLGEVAESVATVLEAANPAPVDTRLLVSTDAMPYLRDHCFVAQRDDWPDEADRRPVVPATTILEHLMAEAERAAPGRIAVGVDDLRLHRWLLAAPAQEVTLTVRPLDRDRVRVAVGDYAEADVLLATTHPTAQAAPLLPNERPPALTAEALYEQRWLFHGPRFRSVTRSVGIAEHGIRGELTVLATPGSLLDGVGQLLGQWLVERHPARWIAFPVRLGRIRWHAPRPPVGTVVDCTVVVRTLTDDLVEADAVLTVAGGPLVSITGWQDRRFDSDERTGAVQRFPSLSALSRRHEGGWWLAAESSPSLASREYYLQKYLAGPENDEYANCPPRTRKEWLLRRIAVKDAVRGLLWDRGVGPVFPAEIAVTDDGAGHCTATGRHRDDLPDLPVTVAFCRDIAVAIVGDGAGIDLAELPAGADTSSGPAVAAATRLAGRLGAGADGTTSGTELVDNPPGGRYLIAWTKQKEKEGDLL